MSESFLEIRGLSYTYPDGTKALQGLNLCVPKGQRMAILGGNGAGKSTLFGCLTGALKPQEGTILLEGVAVDYSRKGLNQLRRRVGLVMQDPDTQLFSASVVQEISFGPMNLGLPTEQVRQRVEAAMAEMNVLPLRQKPVHQLSYGQKKRVSIADILVMEPQVFCLDEPTAFLDPRQAKQTEACITRLSQQGMTVLVSTHQLESLFAWVDTVAVLQKGSVAAVGTPEEIFSQTSLMEQAGLSVPMVYEVFCSMQAAGVLSPKAKPPKDSKDLIELLLSSAK